MVIIRKHEIFYFLLNIAMCCASSDNVISTTTGLISGIDIKTETSTVQAFLGIPYAEPPVGNLRFRRPEPKKPWQGVFNATRKPSPCCQNITSNMYWFSNLENMTEDCLYLNIWVPNISSNNIKNLKSTMVWIHGGAFMSGSSDMDVYDGAKLAAYGDVMVASFNYRVGVFGFLTALIDDANGNMGMYDQIAALQWIKENIANFGGDPEQITLFGESAGSICISLHLVSPLSKNLFKRAILESGSFNNTFAPDATNHQIRSSNSLARIVGCVDDTVNITTDPQHVVDCLKRTSAINLTRAEGILITRATIFFPRSGDEFWPMDITNIFQEFQGKDTELLVGHNEDEGAIMIVVAAPDYFGVNGFNGTENVSKTTAKSIIRGIFSVLKEPNITEIVNYYIEGAKNENFRKAIYNSVGDYFTACSTVFFADFYSKKNGSKVYYYIFTYKDNNGVIADWMGATHFKELQYVFGYPACNRNFTNDETILNHRMMDRWTAFAKTGNPNIPEATHWHPYVHDDPAYLDINVVESLKKKSINERCELWKKQYRNRFRHLFQH